MNDSTPQNAPTRGRTFVFAQLTPLRNSSSSNPTAISSTPATNIGRRILDQEPGAVAALEAFLRAGSSKYPLDVLIVVIVRMRQQKKAELCLVPLPQFSHVYRRRPA